MTDAIEVPELCLQVIVAGLYIGSRSFVSMGLPVLLCVWALRRYVQGEAYVDVTEIFRNCDKEKKQRFIKLGLHLLIFIISMVKYVRRLMVDGYGVSRLVTSMVNDVVLSEGIHVKQVASNTPISLTLLVCWLSY